MSNMKDLSNHIGGKMDAAAAPVLRRSLNDEQLLAALGHKQELRREFSIWSLGCLCICLMATWEALSTVVAPALISGGAPCLFYN